MRSPRATATLCRPPRCCVAHRASRRRPPNRVPSIRDDALASKGTRSSTKPSDVPVAPGALASSAPAEAQHDEPRQGDADGERGGGKEAYAPDPIPEGFAVVEVRERLVRRLDAQEVAQRAPSLLDLVDQELLRRDAPLDLFVVPLEGLDGVLPVLEPPVEVAFPHELGDEPAGAVDLPGLGMTRPARRKTAE